MQLKWSDNVFPIYFPLSNIFCCSVHRYGDELSWLKSLSIENGNDGRIISAENENKSFVLR